jgi:hypothetical protein
MNTKQAFQMATRLNLEEGWKGERVEAYGV